MNFIERIFAVLEKQPAKELLLEVHGETSRATTGKQLVSWVARIRGCLAEAGVSTGDRVALVAPNSSLWCAADLAALAEGAIVVPMYDRQAPGELAGMLANCEPTVLLTSSEELASELRSAWPEHCPIVLLEEAIAHVPSKAPLATRRAKDPVTMIYTSGTSGEPKGVLYSVANVDFMLARTEQALESMVSLGRRPEQLGQDDRVFHYLPFCFAGSRVQLWTQLFRGNPLHMSTDLNNLVQEMSTAAPNYYLNVPTVLERVRNGVGAKLAERGGVIDGLYRAALEAAGKQREGKANLLDRAALLIGQRLVFPAVRKQIGAGLQFLICGSAPLSEETQRWFEAIGIPVYQIYGLTETTAIVTMDQRERVRPGYVGSVIEGVELKVSEAGELLCRGPNIFPGYWRRPEATEKALQDGWFHTGDLAERTSDGFVRIVGRLKDLLVPESGHNVAPGPIEEKLVERVPGVEQAMLLGHARPFLSVILTGQVDDSSVRQALDQINEDLPHYKKVRRYFLAPEPFSVENGLLTANQKLKRQVVEEHYASDIEGLYA